MKPQLLFDLISKCLDHPATSTAQECDLAVFDVEQADATELDALACRAAVRLRPYVLVERWDAIATTDQPWLLTEFAWLIRGFQAWQGPDDPRGRRLHALFAIASAWDDQGGFWPAMATATVPGAAWIRAAEQIVRGARVSLNAAIVTPIWEREKADSLQEADRGEDWAFLANTLHQFQRVVGDTALTQATRALGVCAAPRLATVLGEHEGWLDSVQILRCLDPHHRYEVALAAGTARARFAALALSRGDTVEALGALTRLIVAVATDGKQWRSFVDCFLGPIAQYPSIRAVLGCVLTQISDTAITEFIDVVDLVPLADGRHPMPAILIDFINTAPLRARQILLRLAYERWDRWSFGLPEAGEMTLGPTGSTLDIAVSGWLANYADPDILTMGMRQAEESIASIEQRWHASRLALVCQVNVYRSRYAMFAASERLRQNKTSPDLAATIDPWTLSSFQSARYGE